MAHLRYRRGQPLARRIRISGIVSPLLSCDLQGGKPMSHKDYMAQVLRTFMQFTARGLKSQFWLPQTVIYTLMYPTLPSYHSTYPPRIQTFR